MACYPHASTGFNVAWLIKMLCAGRPYQTPDPPPATREGKKASHESFGLTDVTPWRILVAAAAGSLAVSQRASEAFVHQDLIYDVGMNNGDDTGGGRGWFNRQLKRSHKHADSTFPFGSSGPFGEDLPGRWLDHDEMITTLKHLLEFKEQKRSSPFWDEREYSFWVDVHGRVD